MSALAQDATSAKMAELCQRALSLAARCQQPHEETCGDGNSSVPICTFFPSDRGCMRGGACWYRHVTTPTSVDAKLCAPEDDGGLGDVDSRAGGMDRSTGRSDDEDTAVLAEAQAVAEAVSTELSAIEASESVSDESRHAAACALLDAAEALCRRKPAPVSRHSQTLCMPAGGADAEFVANSSASEDGDEPPRWQPPSSDDDDASKSTTDSSHMQDEEVLIIGVKLDPSRRRKLLPCQQTYVVPTKRARISLVPAKRARNALEASNLSQRGDSGDQRRREEKLRGWAD